MEAKNALFIKADGTVYVVAKNRSFNLGTIGADCELIDLRRKRHIRIVGEIKKKIHEMRESGMKVLDIAIELGISTASVYVELRNKK